MWLQVLVWALAWGAAGSTGDVTRMFVVGFYGTELTPQLQHLVDLGVGGAILHWRNFASLAQLLNLTRALKTRAGRPFLIGINQEGGRVQHLGPPFTPLPALHDIGLLNSVEAASEFGQLVGQELRAAGIDIDFAPVVDVNTNPDNPIIGDRALGSDPALVAKLGQAIVAGLQSAGVAACLKHFPGHGDTSVDSHAALPFVPLPVAELRETHFKPFQEIILASPPPAAIMTSHIVFMELDANNPATMSPTILQGLLRDEMGFQGVIFSDSMEMGAISRAPGQFEAAVVGAVNAGVDMLLVPHSAGLQTRAIEALRAAAASGQVPPERIAASLGRIDALLQEFVKPPMEGDAAKIIGCAKHRSIASRWMAGIAAAGEWKGNEL